ncbi:conserved hypothetical protein [Aspergillus terreus NIH2624]|uniref:Uncharacterized protein n=1 Tax=Aspergillus terreus (strain NIH 2624 / FGSC A1156) TaxID=341663 RepID=Q0CC92_ASPTN|nr:uncharacterized protein ATEG_08692 [Aspergillus terreus NIH2624]EAU30824.1 conserved hypothetical protein [Aspergillus terreus NIH2624]
MSQLFYCSFIPIISTISVTQPTLGMEDYPHHWNETLLGQDFWKDAEEYNKPINDRIEASKFLDRTTATTSNENIAAKPHRRRSSMSDVFGLNMFSALRGRTLDSSRPRRSRSRSSTTPNRPLMSFRGGIGWCYIPKNRQELGLDVFQSMTEQSSRDTDILPIEELAPLCEFRNLRVLKLTGMIQSYQKYIWQAAWLNPRLEELELEMVLPPRIRRGYNEEWPYIKGGWRLSKRNYGEPVYYGQYGDGNLSPKIGVGEYLDKLAIEKAKVRAMALGGRTRNRLSIRTLTLTGFVVDADAFLHWFDPARLRCIHFRNDCVDAGFYLSLPMKKVSILFPREIEEKFVAGRRVDLVSELKVVRLLNGKKVEEIPYRQGLTGICQGRKAMIL